MPIVLRIILAVALAAVDIGNLNVPMPTLELRYGARICHQQPRRDQKALPAQVMSPIR